MKYHLLHLGCQMNQSDAERVRTVIEGMGYSTRDPRKRRTSSGIVACSVRQKAIDKVYSRIRHVELVEEPKEPPDVRHGLHPPGGQGEVPARCSTSSSTSPSCPGCRA